MEKIRQKTDEKMKPELSIVIPCYNEEKNIPSLISRFLDILPKDIPVELVLVDNGSTDGSNVLIKRLMKRHPSIRLVHVKKNIGYGYGILSGLKKARGRFLCWTHADMQTDLKDAITAYYLIIKQDNPKICFIKGSRKGRPFFDRFFTAGMSVFEVIIIRTFLKDINAQPNLFHRDFLKVAAKPPYDFSFDLYFYYIAKRKGFKILRFPVVFRPREYGHSHWNTSLAAKWKFIKRTVDFTLKLRKRVG